MKALLSKRRKDKTGRYISNIGTIRKLIGEDLLFVDHEKPYVALSLRLHMAYMDDEFKLSTWKYRLLMKMGLVRRDVRYAALMENILAYINYRRGMKKMLMYEPSQRLDFLVMNMENTKPLLVGYYQNGVVDYSLFCPSSA